MYIDKHEVHRAFRVGLAGPVSHSKTAFLACFYKWLWPAISMAVITHHIYPQKDMEFLLEGFLPSERILKLNNIPIREDVSTYENAISELENAVHGLELIFIESNDDNSIVPFSSELVDAFVYIVDSNHSVLHRREAGIIQSDFLVVNRIDEAVSNPVSEAEVKTIRGDHLFIFTDLKDNTSLHEMISWLDDLVHASQPTA